MKDITDLTVAQVRIYPADCFPMVHLRLDNNLKALREEYGFAEVQPQAGSIVFENGSLQQADHLILISGALIEPRRLVLKVLGSSSDADVVCQRLITSVMAFDKDRSPRDCHPLIMTQETSCAVTLEVDFDGLLSPEFVRFLRKQVRGKLKTEHAVPTFLGLQHLSFAVKYAPAEPNILEYDITVSDKVLTIEPRAGTALKEKRFFTSSPTDSDTHLSLLGALERTLKGPQNNE